MEGILYEEPVEGSLILNGELLGYNVPLYEIVLLPNLVHNHPEFVSQSLTGLLLNIQQCFKVFPFHLVTNHCALPIIRCP